MQFLGPTFTPVGLNGHSFLFTMEEALFIRANYRLIGRRALTTALNCRFGNGRSEAQVRCFITNHGLRSGRTGHFEKGTRPWNKGVKGYMSANATSFKKGNVPHTKRRLWSERINRDGFIEISIPEPNPWTGAPTRFKHKHVWLWEVKHGPVPKGHAVIFIDGDKLNCVDENLMLVTRAELLSLNLHGYKDSPEELKPSVLVLAKVEAKAGIRTRPARGREGVGR